MASLPANGRRRAGRRTVAPALAALLGATLVAGCGGSSDAGSDARDVGETPTAASPTAPTLPADQAQKQACTLVTQAEVEAAVGGRVTASRQENQEGRSGSPG